MEVSCGESKAQSDPLEDKRTEAIIDVPADAHRSHHVQSRSWVSMLMNGLMLCRQQPGQLLPTRPRSHEAQLLSVTRTAGPAANSRCQPWPVTLEMRGFSRPITARLIAHYAAAAPMTSKCAS
jgi:hypothetical protein